jgi:hypothetical protein
MCRVVLSPTIIYDLVTIYHIPHVIPNSTFDSKDIPFLGSIHLDTALNLVVGLFSQYFVSDEQFLVFLYTVFISNFST